MFWTTLSTKTLSSLSLQPHYCPERWLPSERWWPYPLTLPKAILILGGSSASSAICWDGGTLERTPHGILIWNYLNYNLLSKYQGPNPSIVCLNVHWDIAPPHQSRMLDQHQLTVRTLLCSQCGTSFPQLGDPLINMKIPLWRLSWMVTTTARHPCLRWRMATPMMMTRVAPLLSLSRRRRTMRPLQRLPRSWPMMMLKVPLKCMRLWIPKSWRSAWMIPLGMHWTHGLKPMPLGKASYQWRAKMWWPLSLLIFLPSLTQLSLPLRLKLGCPTPTSRIQCRLQHLCLLARSSGRRRLLPDWLSWG